MMTKEIIYAIDFDGTMVTHEYPNVGKDIGAVPVIKELIRRGNKVILFTMRHGKTLTDAINWCTDNGIVLWAANVNPDQHAWSESRKVYAHVYIDDAALGCPLIFPDEGRPYVDWRTIAQKHLGIDGEQT